MPERPQERAAAEKEFKRRLRLLGKKYRPRLTKAMGSPPDPRNIPESLWKEIEEDHKHSSYWLMLSVFFAWYNLLYDDWGSPPLPSTVGRNPLPDQDELPQRLEIALPPADRKEQVAGRKWAEQRSQELSVGLIKTSRKRLQKATEQLKIIARGPSKQGQPTATPAEQKQIAEDALDDIFGDSRLDRIAVTETTGMITAGETAIFLRVKQELGWEIIRIWHTEEDDRVCPICQPLDRKDEDFFAPRVGSPPAHIKCRCWLTYKLVRQKQLAVA